jgi:signal transduction histidine kinase
MKGDVTVESTVGGGSRFTLSLPRARHTASEAPTASPAKSME